MSLIQLIQIETDQVTSVSGQFTALAHEVGIVAADVAGIAADSTAVAGTSAGLAGVTAVWGHTSDRMTGGLSGLAELAAVAVSRAGWADRRDP